MFHLRESIIMTCRESNHVSQSSSFDFQLQYFSDEASDKWAFIIVIVIISLGKSLEKEKK